MDAILVNDIEYPLPDDFTLAQWKQLIPHTANWKKLIADAFGVEEELLSEMSSDAQQIGASLVYQHLYPVDKEPNTDGLISFKDMTLGQFIDLEAYIGMDANKKIVEISNVLFDKEITDETYVSEIWGALQSYLNYRTLLYRQYEVLFGIDDDAKEVIEDKPSKTQDNARGWYNTVMYIANDDLLKANQVVERPVIEAFNYLAYKKTKAQEEMNRLRQQQLERKYKR